MSKTKQGADGSLLRVLCPPPRGQIRAFRAVLRERGILSTHRMR